MRQQRIADDTAEESITITVGNGAHYIKDGTIKYEPITVSYYEKSIYKRDWFESLLGVFGKYIGSSAPPHLRVPAEKGLEEAGGYIGSQLDTAVTTVDYVTYLAEQKSVYNYSPTYGKTENGCLDPTSRGMWIVEGEPVLKQELYRETSYISIK